MGGRAEELKRIHGRFNSNAETFEPSEDPFVILVDHTW
jgi:hypothetical protein